MIVSRAAALAALLCTAVAQAAHSAPRLNVLVILADDLGYSDLGAYGGEIRTPNLERLAAEGTLFTDFHSTPLCSPTRAELLTGADHHLVGVGALLAPRLWYQKGDHYGGLNAHARTLAQTLRAAGWHTAMAGKWHLDAKGPPAWGFEDSFYLDPEAGAANNFAPAGNEADVPHYDNGKPVTLSADFFSSDAYTDRLIADLKRWHGDGQPFFAYLSFQAAHNPIQAPAEFLERYRGAYDEGYDAVRARRIARQKELGLIPQDFAPAPLLPLSALSPSSPGFLLNYPWRRLSQTERRSEARQMEVYAAMVENMDANVGRLLDALRASGDYARTLIVFLSDNGPDGNGDLAPGGAVDARVENFGRPGSFVTRSVGWAQVSSAPFRGFKASVMEGGTSVPLIVKLPGQAHRQSTALTSVRDLAPTILAAAGVAAPADAGLAPVEGVSLLPLLRGEKAEVRGDVDVLADEMYNHRYVIRGRYKLERTDPLLYGWSFFADHHWQLFDRAADRGETRALAERRVGASARANAQAEAATLDALAADWQRYAERVGAAAP